MDGFINACANLVSNLHILRGEPAAHPLGLEIGMEAPSEGIIFARVTDEQGIILDGVQHRGAPKIDPFLRYPSTTQKVRGAAIWGELNRINFNARWPFVVDFN